MLEVYRGSINTWECDEMGHMNVRFYVAKMMEGLAEFAHVVGLDNAFRPGARSTLAPRDQHIRFIKEAHAGKPFAMKACVLDVTDTSLLLYQQIDHATGEPCAAYRTWIDHVDIGSGVAFPWSNATLAAFENLKASAPAENAPRSLDLSVRHAPRATLADADKVNAPVIGRGVVQPAHCDLTGRMMPEMVLGRVSDSIAHLLRPWREQVAEEATARGETVRMGGAVLEYRLVYRRWPRAGRPLRHPLFARLPEREDALLRPLGSSIPTAAKPGRRPRRWRSHSISRPGRSWRPRLNSWLRWRTWRRRA